MIAHLIFLFLAGSVAVTAIEVCAIGLASLLDDADARARDASRDPLNPFARTEPKPDPEADLFLSGWKRQ